MPSLVHTPICIQHDIPISASVWKKEKQRQGGKGASQRVDMQELSPGLFLLYSEMKFDRGVELREEYPESSVLQLSFCLNGCMEWDFETGKGGHYEISPTEFSLQCGHFSKCSSYYKPGETYRTLGIVMEGDRFAELTEQLEAVRLICPKQKICSHVFPTTSEIRLTLQHLVDCPPERKLRKMYLEGKVLELLSLFCEDIVGKRGNEKNISREDYRSLQTARELIDRQFLHPLTIQQIAQECFLSETKLKQGFKACFDCTVYEYIVEKRMSMAYRLLQSGQHKVKNVAWMVGYGNVSHFIDAFKKRYGITPGEL